MSAQLQATYPRVMPLIDGALIASASDEALDVTNPSNGQHLFSIPAGAEHDVNRAVDSARSAFVDGRWRELLPSLRKKALHRFATLITAEAGSLDALDAAEMGKPVREALFSAASAAASVQFYAESVDKLAGSVFSSDKNSFVTQRRVPRGVVAAVVPWNFPTFNAVLKIAPALAAGNCVVLKPSELASCSALRLAQLALQAGIPPGVLNVVPGRGEVVGRALGLHSDIDMIAFTGSTQVGKAMLQYAGQSNMKVVMAECGGKSPQIVFADGVDLDAAAGAIAKSLLTNQGQICSVGSRLLVHESIEATLIEKIRARFKQVVIGDAQDPKTTFGPLVSSTQCARVMDYIETAGADGAEVVAGGRRVLRESGGYFVEPTILHRVSPRARVAQEEIFGPVLAVIPFRDEAEAIQIANGTMYGLAAYVWTSKVSTAMRVAKSIDSSVRVYAAPVTGEGAGFAASSEPAHQSGFGAAGGLAGVESYMRRQLISIFHD